MSANDWKDRADLIDKNSRAYRNGLEDGRADLMRVAEAVAKRAEHVVRNPSGPEGEDGYNLGNIADDIEAIDLAAIIAEVTK